MTRVFLLLSLLVLIPATAVAQAVPPGTPQISAVSAVSATAPCSVYQATGGSITIAGTWVGTLQFESTIDGTTYAALSAYPIAGGAAVTSTTAAGTWSFSNTGFTANAGVRVRASAWTSGNALITCTTVGASFVWTSGQDVSSVAVGQGTITTNIPAISSTGNWNNAAVTFTHWLANVTDTASGAASKLLDLQVGGSSKFSVTKGGAGAFALGVEAANYSTLAGGYYLFSNGTNFTSSANGVVRTANNGSSNTFDLTLSDWGTTLTGESISVANTATISLGTTPNGVLYITTSSNTVGIYQLRGADQLVVEISDPQGAFTGASGGVGSTNIYWSAGNARYELQNNVGGTVSYRLVLIGS